jgi:hypothetical protein
MTCDTRRPLTSTVYSAAHHLQFRIKEDDKGNEAFALADVKRMAQDLLDALEELSKHDEQHGCTK